MGVLGVSNGAVGHVLRVQDHVEFGMPRRSSEYVILVCVVVDALGEGGEGFGTVVAIEDAGQGVWRYLVDLVACIGEEVVRDPKAGEFLSLVLVEYLDDEGLEAPFDGDIPSLQGF